jgi:hypothetical protein
MNSPVMMYMKELNQLRGYLTVAYKRLRIPLMDCVNDDDHEKVCSVWRDAVLNPFEKKLQELTARPTVANPQDAWDALDEIRAFSKRVVIVLEG